MTREELMKKIDEAAQAESKKYGEPSLYNYKIAIEKAEELAKTYGADIYLSKMACMLMDIKIGECIKNHRQSDHIQESYKFSKELLEKFGADDETKKILLYAVLNHHGTKDHKFDFIEAEICSNADCYRFLTLPGAYNLIRVTSKWGQEHNASIDYCLSKVEEKFNALTLKKAKDDLYPNYEEIKNFLLKSKMES